MSKEHERVYMKLVDEAVGYGKLMEKYECMRHHRHLYDYYARKQHTSRIKRRLIAPYTRRKPY